MNRCIYCDDNISIWADNLSTDKTVANCYHVINNKTRKSIMSFCGEFHGCLGSQVEEIPIDIQAAFNLYDRDGNVEHIMPKEDL